MMKNLAFIVVACSLLVQEASGQCDVDEIFGNETTHAVCFDILDNVRKCYTNNIPNHTFGPFGGGNTIEGQDFEYSMCLNPELGTAITDLREDPTSLGCGNGIIFGISMQGVNYSPFARLYWVNPTTQEENLNYHVEADFTLNMDLNGGHVNAVHRYHYHNIASDYFTNDLQIDGTAHSPILGYAADGFPIYYKYLYKDSFDPNGSISAFESSYALKSGTRPGNDITAPGGTYNGNYIEDYEYVDALSELDECGGRFGITPEYPNGTYYYVLTDNWPYIPRCLKGTFVDNSFRLGQNCPPSTAGDDCSSSTTGVEQNGLEHINVDVYPNPTQTHIRINIGSSFSREKIIGVRLYDMKASTVYHTQVFNEYIETSSMNKGTYFIQIDTEQGQYTKKIVIQ